jgi:hypothetical protein
MAERRRGDRSTRRRGFGVAVNSGEVDRATGGAQDRNKRHRMAPYLLVQLRDGSRRRAGDGGGELESGGG